jgi:hypothetical protein
MKKVTKDVEVIKEGLLHILKVLNMMDMIERRRWIRYKCFLLIYSRPSILLIMRR